VTALIAELIALTDAPDDTLLEQVETIGQRAVCHMLVRLVWRARKWRNGNHRETEQDRVRSRYVQE
jgi:hypothetical protein